ncbi:MAG TPA: FAD:protein FMN transferase [Gammaproteobacteria bacterium]|nr:FAD:protein FMN transferase [Gammaproteobacteria bacterium]
MFSVPCPARLAPSRLLRGLPHRLALLVCLLVVAGAAHAAWFKDEAAIMGTRVAVELWHEDPAAARAAMDAVLTEMRRIDAAMSPLRTDSELARLNREAARHPVEVSAELYDLIARAQRFSRLSDGAFDITFASVGHLYDFRRGIAPDAAQIAAALPGIDYHQVILEDGHRIRFARPEVVVDLGGIAKGHAVDRAIALLQARGIREALVSAGGDSRILGDHHGRPWTIGIRDPYREKGSAVVLPLSNTALSTSGDYERFFMRDGVRFHHILSPRTGRPVHGTRSVTILGPDATTTDALSTTVFVLGAEAGLALIESLPGIEAVLIDDQGRLHFTRGLAPPTTP